MALGGLTLVWLGLVWARSFAPSLPAAVAVAVPGEAPGALAGPAPRTGGVPGDLAWLAGPRGPRHLAHLGPSSGAGRQGSGLGSWDGLPGRHLFQDRRFGVAGGRLGLLSRLPVPPTALCQVPLQPLPQVLGKAISRTAGQGVPGGRVSPHVSMGRPTCPLLWPAAPQAAQPCGVCLTTGGVAPASLPYDRLTPVA